MQDGTISQAYANLPNVKDDLEEGMKGAKFIDADKYGDTTERQFILNEDLDNDSFTVADMNNLTRNVARMFIKDPEIMHFGMFLYAGHGMIKDGVQNFLIN